MDIAGITLSSGISSEDLFPGFNFGNYEYVNVGDAPDLSAETTTDKVTSAPIPSSSSHATAPVTLHCADDHSTALILLFAMGSIASVLGFIEAALHNKKSLQNHNSLHLFAANFGMTFFLLLTTVGRKYGSLHVNDILYKVLTFVVNVGENVFAFQLTLLTAVRLRELAWSKKFPTTKCTKISCYVLWLIAVLLSALILIKDLTLTYTGDANNGSVVLDTYASGFVVVKTLLGFILPCVVVLFCFAMVFYQRKMHISTHGEIGEIVRGVKEVVSLYAVFVVCVLPYQAYQLHSTRYAEINDCTTLSDMLMCFVALSSMLIPSLHFANMHFVERNWEITLTPVHQKGKESPEATSCGVVASSEKRNEERVI